MYHVSCFTLCMYVFQALTNGPGFWNAAESRLLVKDPAVSLLYLYLNSWVMGWDEAKEGNDMADIQLPKIGWELQGMIFR